MYEYKVIDYYLSALGVYDENGKYCLRDPRSCESKLNASINEMAKDGWKVISVVSHTDLQVAVFYERKIQ